MNAPNQPSDDHLDPNLPSSSTNGSWEQRDLPTHSTDEPYCSEKSSHGECEFAEEFDANDVAVDIVANDRGTEREVTDHNIEVNGGNNSVQPESIAAMTLLPPPPSWFNFESDTANCKHNEESKLTPVSTQSDETTDDSTKSKDAFSCVEIATASSSHAKQRKESSALPAKIDEFNVSSHLDIPLLPEYNSSDAHMFDMPVSFACNTSYETKLKNEESLSDSMSIQSAIDTLISQTLSFTSQTVSKTIPILLHECTSSAIQKSLHKLKTEYARLGPRKYLRASDLGSVGGYFRPSVIASFPNDDNSVVHIESSVALGKGKDNHFDWMWMDGREVRFTNLPWIERQLVHEWRTYEWTANENLADSYFESSFCLESSIDHIEVENGRTKLSTAPRIAEADPIEESKDAGEVLSEDDDEEEFNQVDTGEYERARTLAPRPLPMPEWEHATSCYICQKSFGPTLHRHHCRRCGHSYCNAHSNYFHQLPHLGYDKDVRERVCKGCKVVLDARDLEERVAWRLSRCRDFLAGILIPYFETGVDTVEDAAFRLTRVAIRLARSIPLGAQAYVAIETVEILRKHGLSGVYGLLLRKEFLAAADLLCKVLGINKKQWPLSVHELSAAIFYALAQHRALRGLRPDGEEMMHSLIRNENECRSESNQSALMSGCTMKRINSLYAVNESNTEEEEAGDTIVWEGTHSKNVREYSETMLDETDVYDPIIENAVDLLVLSQPKRYFSNQSERVISETNHPSHGSNVEVDPPFKPVCEPVPDGALSALLFYAPLALNFIYAECEVDMQLLAAQQGWRLVYASLDQSQSHPDEEIESGNQAARNSGDKPASALFAHDDLKIACLSVRGTTSIQDVVTDIRAMPVPFPQEEEEEGNEYTTDDAFCDNDEWTSVFRGKGLASCGMAYASLNLFRENADSLTYLARNGYRIRIVGHSLGGGVATLLGILMSHHLEKLKLTDSGSAPFSSEDDRLLRVYGYGTPSCVDGRLADYTRAYATNVILHDDVVPRLTPTSIRSLLKHLLHIRETWVRAHLSDDLKCYHERAYKVWPTRVRESFSLSKKMLKKTSKKLKKSYRKRIQRSICDNHQDKECTECENHHGISNDRTNEATDSEADTIDEGLDVEGDLFFDALNDVPLNESDDESSVERARPNRVSSNTVLVECEDDWVPFDEPPLTTPTTDELDTNNRDEAQQSFAADSSPQILEEFPLPRMFVPGKIVHIYTHRGGYKAAYVPRKFKSLRRISMAGNCLTDHMSKSYYESMLEVKTVRAAKYDLPSWIGFDQDCTCACCASLFTWASTSNTEAQAARDKHNCRSCGSLVCDPCSKNRVPIPLIGITQSVRVCDRCYNGWGSLHSDSNSATRDNCNTDEGETELNKVSTVQMRRSRVVDELAARLPTVK